MKISEAIKWIDNRMCWGRGQWTEHHQPIIDEPWQAGLMAIEALKATQWTPCSERLPEEGIRVITFDTYGDINIMYFDGRETEDGYIWKDDLSIEWCGIIAWMPLPKPYGREESE